MAFIEIKTLIEKDKFQTISINTGFIYKIFKDNKNLNYSIIAYDYDLETTDIVAEQYTDLIKRIKEAEDIPDANPSDI
jgi:hypothetical protein